MWDIIPSELSSVIPKKFRIERLVKEYAEFDNSLLADAVGRIEKRLGGQNAKEALDALSRNDYEKVSRFPN